MGQFYSGEEIEHSHVPKRGIQEDLSYGYPINLNGWPEFTGKFTSKVVSSPDHWEDNCGIVDAHEGLRVYMCILPMLFNDGKDGKDQGLFRLIAAEDITRWQLQTFFTWYLEFFDASLHFHHRAEEEFYYPWLAERVTPPEGITGAHTRLVELLAIVKELSKYQDDWNRVLHKRLLNAMQELNDLLWPHLTEEEYYVTQGLRQSGYTFDEEMGTRRRILTDFGFSGCKTFLPTIVYAMHRWGGPAEYKKFTSAIPSECVLLMEANFIHHYRRNSLGALKALIDSDETFVHESLVTDFLYKMKPWLIHLYEENDEVDAKDEKMKKNVSASKKRPSILVIPDSQEVIGSIDKMDSFRDRLPSLAPAKYDA